MFHIQSLELEEAYQEFVTCWKPHFEELEKFRTMCDDAKSLRFLKVKTKAIEERQQRLAQLKLRLSEIDHNKKTDISHVETGNIQNENAPEYELDQIVDQLKLLILEAKEDRFSVRMSQSFNDLDSIGFCLWCACKHKFSNGQTCPFLGSENA